MLLGWSEDWSKEASIVYVTLAQMLCGIAKDLVKLPGKTVAKLVTKQDEEARLFTLISRITGWKNSVKGVGYFLGSLLVLWDVGPNGTWGAVFVLLALVLLALPWPMFRLGCGLGRDSKKNATLRAVFCLPSDATAEDRAHHYNRNWLSLGRCFLFGARDCWFEVPLPLYLQSALGWSRPATGAVLAGYIVIYGQCQANAMTILLPLRQFDKDAEPPLVPHKWHVVLWAALIVPSLVWVGVVVQARQQSLEDAILLGVDRDASLDAVLVLIGVVVFAFVFGVNSAINSGLVAKYSTKNKASANLGFYYMSNAAGRLLGTLTSGLIYSSGDYDGQHFAWCFWAATASTLLVVIASLPLRDSGRLHCGDCCACGGGGGGGGGGGATRDGAASPQP
jgi:hypothetical protein